MEAFLVLYGFKCLAGLVVKIYSDCGRVADFWGAVFAERRIFGKRNFDK